MDQDFLNLLAYLDSLPYFQRRLEIKHRVKPSQSRFLYKYKSINQNDSQSVDRVRDILIRSHLWLSSPLDFNDPFDMSIKINIKTTGKELRERANIFLKQQSMPWKKREKRLLQISTKSSQELDREMAESYLKNLKTVGVYSFAGDPNNILMWSHYAGEHTGICIQFERSRDYVTLSGALSVKYSEEYPEVDYSVSDFAKSLGKVILRKHEGWSYEKEHRILRPGDAHKYLNFNPQAVVGIIFGCRATTLTREVVENLLEERQRAGLPPIKLYTAQKHGSRYTLRIIR